MATLNGINLRIADAKVKIAAGGGSVFVLRGLEKAQQLLNIIVQRGVALVAWEQRIADSAGNLIGRFRIDALIERATSAGRILTQVESKGVRWDFAARNAPAWQSYLNQLSNQANAFSQTSQTANGIQIQERVIVSTSKIPPGLETKAQEIINLVSPHYSKIFWGLDAFDEWLAL